ncbi:MAG: type II toxin-antitoxin system HicB family antitoxin [Candidatus Sumerlaeia bacterium]|nr:type II toxin-antitoxin system HicB family antitoxin [Candidatus Sumerlaeia bacterium]
MVEREYRVVIERGESGGFWAHVPALPGCFTAGETVEDLMRHAQEAIAAYIEVLEEQGRPVPEGDAPGAGEKFEVPLRVAV